MKNNRIAVLLIVGAVILAGFAAWDYFRKLSPLAVAKNVIPAVVPPIPELPPIALPFAEERVTVLPDDGKRWCSVFVLSDKDSLTDANDRRLMGYFESNDRLQSLNGQCTVWVYDSGDRLYRSRYENILGTEKPQYLLIKTEPGQDKGKAVYKVSGGNIPASSDQMAREIQAAIDQHVADCTPRPSPRPMPEPSPEPSPDFVPDIRPDVPDDGTVDNPSNGVSLLALAAAALMGGLAGAFHEAKKGN